MYNQPTDPDKRLYKNTFDCLWKTIKIEGFTGLFVLFFCVWILVPKAHLKAFDISLILPRIRQTKHSMKARLTEGILIDWVWSWNLSSTGFFSNDRYKGSTAHFFRIAPVSYDISSHLSPDDVYIYIYVTLALILTDHHLTDRLATIAYNHHPRIQWSDCAVVLVFNILLDFDPCL